MGRNKNKRKEANKGAEVSAQGGECPYMQSHIARFPDIPSGMPSNYKAEKGLDWAQDRASHNDTCPTRSNE